MKFLNFLTLSVWAGVSCLTLSACSDSDDEPAAPQVPTVETAVATEVTENSATVNITITSDGGAEVTACGVVWDEEANPTVDLPTKTVFDGTDENYTCQLTGLNANTTYYYRAYATNESGTAYGEEFSFTTGMEATKTVEVNGITIDLVLVEGGTFQMGATTEQETLANKYGITDEFPVHDVTLDSYYMAKYEVTQALWIEIMGTNPSAMIQDNTCPVDNISYLQCLDFVEKLNQRTGLTFALPTEAQWEYAARGGNKAQSFVYSGSNDATEVGWVMENMVNFGQHPCGEKAPNELGIYDMTGNVNEWCSDLYGAYPAEAQTNPTGANPDDSYAVYVVRGGSYLCEGEKWCRNTKRISYPDTYAQMDLGMRLVLNVNTPAE